jgi:amino acid adenylation domain-containing protein
MTTPTYATRPALRLSPPLTPLRQPAAGVPEPAAGLPEPTWWALPDLLTDRARRCGSDIAIRFGARPLTFRDWEVLANRLGRYLRSRGVGRGDRVGLLIDRGLSLPIAMLAVLKAGAAYLPLNSAEPPARIAQILDDARPALVLTQRTLASALPNGAPDIVDLDACSREICAMPDTPLGAEIHPEDLAYVIFTSGSTGRPKGVAVPHRAFANLLRTLVERPGITRQDVLLAVTAPSFDPAGLELCHPLVSGGQTVIADRSSTVDGKRLRRLIAGHGVTLLHGTPATWRLLDGAPELAGLTAFVGGEALTPDVAGPMVRATRAVWNLYGPTETTVYSTVRRIEARDVAEASGALPIGWPVGGTTCHVLEANLRPVPPGIAGELHIGGEGVAHGYVGRPGLTAQRFVADPYGPPGSRLYRTGDRVRLRPDGDIEFLGRDDDQVKVRGFRVETNEVAVHLAAHEAVEQAVVIAHEFAPGDRRLVGYVKTAGVRSHELREHLARRLPSYMLPAAYVTLTEFPVTAHGKVDRTALPVPGVPAAPSPARRDEPIPASAGQERAWRLQQASCHRTVQLTLTGPLDAGALEFALSAVIARHPALRTRLECDGAGLRQVVGRAGRLSLAAAPPAADQPIQAGLTRLGADEHLLTISIQHVAADGRSWDMFRHDLAAFYQSAVERRRPDLRDLPVPAARYAAIQRARITDESIRYWRNELAGLPSSGPPGGEAATLMFDLPGPVPPLGALLAAFHRALADVTGRTDAAIGTAVSVREDDPAVQPFGMFDNTVAVRADVAAAPTFAELVAQVTDRLAAGLAHRDVPLALPLPMVIRESAPRVDWRLSGLCVEALAERSSAAPPDLALTLGDTGAGVLTYPVRRYERAAAEGFAARYAELLRITRCP